MSFDISKIKGIEPLKEAPADSSLNTESQESSTEKKEEVITDKPKEETVADEKLKTEEIADDKPKEEKPVEEKPKEELNSEEKPKEETPKTVTEEKEVITSRKGKEIFDDLNNKFEQAHNMTLIQAMDIVNTDYDSIDETDVIIAAMLLNDPNVTQEELDFAIDKFDILFKDVEEQKKMIEEGLISEKDHKALDIEYTKLLRTSKSTMKAFQDETKTKLDSFDIQAPVSNEKQTDNSEIIAKQLSEQVAPVLAKYQSESFDIKDKDGKVVDTIKIDLNDADRKLVSDILNGDVTGVFKMWMDKDGNIDLGKMVRSIYRDRDFERISKITYNQGLAKGQLSQVKEQSNLDFENKDHIAETKKDLDPNLVRILKDLRT